MREYLGFRVSYCKQGFIRVYYCLGLGFRLKVSGILGFVRVYEGLFGFLIRVYSSLSTF